MIVWLKLGNFTVWQNEKQKQQAKKKEKEKRKQTNKKQKIPQPMVAYVLVNIR